MCHQPRPLAGRASSPVCRRIGVGEREKTPAHMDPIVRGNIDRYLDLIEEVVREPEAYGIDAPDLEEAAERILRSLGTDGKASEEAIEDRMRAELREWRRDRPGGQFLAKMYQLEDQRRATPPQPPVIRSVS